LSHHADRGFRRLPDLPACRGRVPLHAGRRGRLSPRQPNLHLAARRLAVLRRRRAARAGRSAQAADPLPVDHLLSPRRGGVTAPPSYEETRGLAALAGLALFVGALAGLVGAVFRLSLLAADHARNWVIAGLQGRGIAGLALVVLGCGAAAMAAAWLVRRFS